MRRILLFLLVAVITAFLSSCLTVEEHLTLRADGSGTQVAKMDMSEMLDNPLLKMSMQEELGGDVEGRKDSSFIVFEELLEENPQWTEVERELITRSQGNMVMDVEQEELYVEVVFAFDDLTEIDALNQLLGSANKPETEEGEESNSTPSLGMFSGTDFLRSSMMVKGKKFLRSSILSPDFVNPLGEEMEGEGAEMFKEMFSDASMLYIMEFPGKVKKVKGFEGHEVDGNSVIQIFDFMDLIDRPEIVAAGLSGQVKFKK